MLTPIHKTLQNGRPEPLSLLPWPYGQEVGQIFIMEYKEAGQIVRIERYKLVQYTIRGDRIRRWDRQS